MKLSIVIPNYNGKVLLAKNLPKVIGESIRQSKNQTVEIIIVDDGSTDGSIEEVKNQKSKVKSHNLKLKIIQNKKNLGFSSAVNRGVKEAEGEIVFLLNTDVYPEAGFIEAVLPHFQDPKIFAVGMLDKSIEGGKIVRRGRGIGKWRRGFYVHKRGKVNKTDTAWVSGGSGAFRKSIWEKLGGFDQIYNPFYWEDIDLSYRAKKAGYKILFEPRSIVFHEHEGSVIKEQFPSWKIRTISFRNQLLFVWKNADFSQSLSHLLWLPYHIIKSILTGDICFLIGLLWAIERRLTFRS